MEMQTPATSADTAPDPADIVIARAEAKQRRRWRWLIAGGIASLLVGYPLSFGTAILLDQKGMLPVALYPILQVIYSPFIYALANVPMAEYLLRSYLWFFGIDL